MAFIVKIASIVRLSSKSVIKTGANFSTSLVYRQGKGPAFIYDQKILTGQLKPDRRQSAIVEDLQIVYDDIAGYNPGLLRRFFFKSPPRGLYIYGSVGCGKTTMMDLFFESVEVSIDDKSFY